ncbi:hypothetical protein COH29_06135 [Neisseria meningitidis]|nr:hypothetical protein COH29_06135 [Neisseria meningitidis]
MESFSARTEISGSPPPRCKQIKPTGYSNTAKKSRPNPKGTDGQTHYGENVLLNESAKQTLLKRLQL